MTSAALGRWALLAYAALYLFVLYLPVLFLPLFSFNDSIFMTFPLSGFTFRWYGEMAADTGMLAALWTSIEVGLITAVASTALGLTAARALTRYRVPGGGAITGVILFPLFIPDIVLGISLLILVNALEIPLSVWSVILGHIVVCTPFAMAVMLSRFDGFDKSLEEASLDLGESGWSTFWRVTFPIVMPGVIASLMLTFIVSFDEFLVAFFLAGSEPTLPVFIFSQLRFPQKLPGVLALGACILIVSVILVVIAEYVRRIGLSPAARSRHIG